MRMQATCSVLALLCQAAYAQPVALGETDPVTTQVAPTQVAPTQAGPVASAGSGGVTIPMNSATRSDPADESRFHSLVLESGSGRVISLPVAVANVFVADPKVAEVRPASAKTLFVFGTAPGRTTLAALDEAGHMVAQYQLTVRPSAYNSAEASAAIARALPGSNIRVDTLPNGLGITGEVATAADAARATELARAFLVDKQTIENRLTVASSTQISLRVRIAEMSRSVSRELGVNWTAIPGIGKYAAIGLTTSNPLTATTSVPNAFVASYIDGNTTLSGVLDALAQNNLVHMLAEPNLTTTSGEPASFLVGGEFPIPISQQNNAITVIFKQYGVNLSFVPTVMSDGRINVHVRPEVSQLTSQGAVQLSSANNSISVPALTVRRADTTVNVGSGDSFAIAGLLQDNVTQNVSAVPFLGEVPILGALFRSDSFQRNESELVIIVTPYVVRPTRDPAALHQPDDGYVPPTDLERILLLRQVGQTKPVRPMHIPGAAGFIVQ
jgi:pilus assembly protein CpaC